MSKAIIRPKVSSRPRASSTSTSGMPYFIDPETIKEFFENFARILATEGKLAADEYIVQELNESLVMNTSVRSKDNVFGFCYEPNREVSRYENYSNAVLKTLYQVRVKKFFIKPPKPDTTPSNEMITYDAFNVWLSSDKKNMIEGFIFDPSQCPGYIERSIPVTRNNEKMSKFCRFYNRWPGFSLEGVFNKMSPEDQNESQDNFDYIMEKFIFEIICDKKQERLDYLLNWLSCMVNVPQKKTEKLIILLGLQGIGKSMLMMKLAALFGEVGVLCPKGSSLLDRFSGHLFKDKILVCLDEARFDNDAAMDALKSAISNDVLITEQKFAQAEQSKNCLNFIMSSNDESCLHFRSVGHERRPVFFEVNGKRQCDREFFGKVTESFDLALPAFFQFLHEYDYKHDELEKAPHSVIMSHLKAGSMNTVETFFHECVLNARNLPPQENDQGPIYIKDVSDPDQFSWIIKVNMKALHNRYSQFTTDKRVNYTLFVILMKGILKKAQDGKDYEDQTDVWDFPTYEVCKRIDAEMLGGTVVQKKRKRKQPASQDNTKTPKKKKNSEPPRNNQSMDDYLNI